MPMNLASSSHKVAMPGRSRIPAASIPILSSASPGTASRARRPQTIQRLATGDGKQPPPQIATVPQARIGLQGRQQSVLQAVIRLRPPHVPNQEPAQTRSMLIQQPLKRRKTHTPIKRPRPPKCEIASKYPGAPFGRLYITLLP